VRKATQEDVKLIRDFLLDSDNNDMCYRDIMKHLNLDIPHRTFAQIARNQTFHDPDYRPTPRKRGRRLPPEKTEKRTVAKRGSFDRDYERLILKIPIVLHNDIVKIVDAFGYGDIRVWYQDAIAKHYLTYKDQGFITTALELLSRRNKNGTGTT